MATIDYARLPFRERPDLTPYLIHLTRAAGNKTALDVLTKILKDGLIRGSSPGESFIKGRRRAVCFMDVPFMALKHICTEENRNRYEPYGIVVTKKWAAQDRGARPVLYLSNEELRAMGVSPNELWRVVRFEVAEDGWISWLHEREWRAPGSFDLPDKINAVLVKTMGDAEKLRDAIAKDQDAFWCVPKSIIPLNIICQGLDY